MIHDTEDVTTILLFIVRLINILKFKAKEIIYNLIVPAWKIMHNNKTKENNVTITT